MYTLTQCKARIQELTAQASRIKADKPNEYQSDKDYKRIQRQVGYQEQMRLLLETQPSVEYLSKEFTRLTNLLNKIATDYPMWLKAQPHNTERVIDNLLRKEYDSLKEVKKHKRHTYIMMSKYCPANLIL